jgi:methyl-accepting chemotaxis protein
MSTASHQRPLLARLWRRSETDSQPSGCLWTSAVADVEKDLDQLNRSTEADFLAIGGTLGALLSSAREISSEVSTMAEFISGERGQAACEALGSVLRRAREMRESAEAISASLRELSELAAQIRTDFSGFEQTVFSFRLVTTLARIETERLGATAMEVSHLAENFRLHTNNVVARLADVLNDVAVVETRIGSTITHVAELQDQKLSTLPSLISNVEQSLSAFREKQQRAVGASKTLASGFTALSSAITEIVSSIQCHDITRQQIEHVVQALADIRKSGRNRCPSPSQGLALRVQCAQLQSAERLFTSSVTDIDRQLETVSSQIHQMISSHQELLELNREGHDSFFLEVGRCFEVILDAIANYSGLEESVAAAVAELDEVAGRLVKSLNSVRDITVQLKWLTINARISAIHLGPPGEPLNVVAGSMQSLQQECETRCETTGNRIAAMQTALSSGGTQSSGAQAGAEMKVNVRAQIGELHAYGERSSTHWRSIEACAASLRENIQSARTRLAVGQRVSGTLNRSIERIQPFAGEAAAGAAGISNDTAFEQIAHRYTMQGEREIHERLTGTFQQDSQAAEAVPIPDQNTEFGENVELF